MSIQVRLLFAGAMLIAPVSMAMAQQVPLDRTSDKLYYYGPIAPQPPAPPVHEKHHAAHATPAMDVPLDRTSDKLYYYGPIAH